MPRRLDSCVRKVKKKIRQGKIKKTYKKGNRRMKTNAWAICSKVKK